MVPRHERLDGVYTAHAMGFVYDLFFEGMVPYRAGFAPGVVVWVQWPVRCTTRGTGRLGDLLLLHDVSVLVGWLEVAGWIVIFGKCN